MKLLLPPLPAERPGLRRALGFVRGWVRPPSTVSLTVRERHFRGLDQAIRVLEAGPLEPSGGSAAARPGWVLLHGVTVLGLEHPSLVRFVGALAASGARVIVPEITSWTRLELDLEEAQRRLRASIDWMAQSPGVAPGGVGVAGFSFGGPQVLHAASDPEVSPKIRQVLAWGSYARLPNALTFALTGAFRDPLAEAGVEGWLEPDPYGRWVTATHLLPLVPEYGGVGGDGGAVARGLRVLAEKWGVLAFDAMGPAGDPWKEAVRQELPGREAQMLFDLLAPRAGVRPDRDDLQELGARLVEAAALHSPLMDPLPAIRAGGGIPVPVHLFHGESDVLIPWSETRHLRGLLDGITPALYEEITGLFGHTDHGPSAESPKRGAFAKVQEGGRFFGSLRRVLG